MMRDALLGFAIGDAFGVPVEFMTRDEVRKLNLKEMISNNFHHNVPAGSFSDDTSMLIATMDSLIKNNGEINYNHIMLNFFKWLYYSDYTSFGVTFGVGGIVYKALTNFQNGKSALESGCTGIMDNGNGSLMRILPISLYCIENGLSYEETTKIISDASSITHAHDISKMGCVIYTEFLREIINSKDKYKALEYIQSLNYENFSQEAQEAYKKILATDFKNISDTDIKESGYIVDTLEAVLYGIINSNTFEETIIKTVNLGYDTDTNAGIAGSIAGIMYGYEQIPKRWLDKLRRRDYLEELALQFAEILKKNKNASNVLK